jgi:hypothetical protein
MLTRPPAGLVIGRFALLRRRNSFHRRRLLERAEPGRPARAMPPSGLNGRKAMPSSAQWASSASLDRNAGENWFCAQDSWSGWRC